MIVIYLALTVLTVLLYTVRNTCPCMTRCHRKLANSLFWSGLLRFGMEIYFDVGLCIALCLQNMPKANGFTAVEISNKLTIALAVLLAFLPIWTIIFYSVKVTQWKQEKFRQSYGSPLQDMQLDRQDHKWLPVVSPAVFLMRRVSFCLVVVFQPKFLWLQLAVQFFISTGMCIYLIYFMPMQSRSDCIKECFNEVTTVFLMYHIMCFSDFVPEAETRNLLGYSFIGVAGVNILTHASLMMRDNFTKLKRKLCQKCMAKKMQKNMEARL